MNAPEQDIRFFPEDWLHAFPLEKYFDPRRPLELDLGCGKGRFLLARAAARPDIQYFGVDRMLLRLRKIEKKVRQRGLANVRLLRVEGYYAVRYLIPPRVLDQCYIFFPDPWPKAKHHSHRLFDPEFMDALWQTLKPGAAVHVATDHLPYFDEIYRLFTAHPGFAPMEVLLMDESERTDFELLFYRNQPIGRASFRTLAGAPTPA